MHSFARSAFSSAVRMTAGILSRASNRWSNSHQSLSPGAADDFVITKDEQSTRIWIYFYPVAQGIPV